MSIHFFAEVDGVVEIMGNNLTKIHERGEKLDDMERRAERLEEGASMFQKSAQKLKNKSFYENFKMKICYIPGIPSALQLSVRGSFFGTVIEVGCSVMCGDLY